jgi:hypothetical protein
MILIKEGQRRIPFRPRSEIHQNEADIFLETEPSSVDDESVRGREERYGRPDGLKENKSRTQDERRSESRRSSRVSVENHGKSNDSTQPYSLHNEQIEFSARKTNSVSGSQSATTTPRTTRKSGPADGRPPRHPSQDMRRASSDGFSATDPSGSRGYPHVCDGILLITAYWCSFKPIWCSQINC